MIYSDVEVGIDLTSSNLALFIQKAARYKADIFIEKGRLRANAKSLLGLLSLGITHRDKVRLSANGVDEDCAIEDLRKYLQS